MTSAVYQRSNERCQLIIDELKSNPKLNHELPGLATHLKNIVDPKIEVTPEASLRGFLRVFWKSETDGTYSKVLNRHLPDERRRIRAFVEDEKCADDCGSGFKVKPSLGAREELPIIDANENGIPDELEQVSTLSKIGTALHEVAHDIREAIESFFEGELNLFDDLHQKNKVATYINEEFHNWGGTVSNTPHLTCVPRTSYGIQQIVKLAKSKQMNVRASGYRHSWSPVFGKNGQILISTLGLTKATMLPNIESLPGSEFFQRSTELNSIEFVGTPQPGQKRLVRIGTSATNQMLRRWCNAQKLDASSTLPMNVIMVEITLGGSNAPICHGAGRTHATLSDLVHTIEYVDANGELQKLSKDENAQEMNVAAGCFGMLGIVTHITLEMEPMSYAVMIPQKIPVMQAVPPPPGLSDDQIPEVLRIPMTPEERAQAQAEFERRARDNFYYELFWFPYTTKVWVNAWDTTDDPTGNVEYPSTTGTFMDWVQSVLFLIYQESSALLHLQEIFPWTQATLVSKMALYLMPEVTDPSKAVKTKLPNALHFRRAIQNVKVRDTEWEIPLIPKYGRLEDAKFDDEIDFANVQKAWWDAILIAYKYNKTTPFRMPMEMRITGSSNITMAPFRGHALGTCSIEVLTMANMGKQWMGAAQEVIDAWLNLRDHEGNFLPTRPHWAKEYMQFKARGEPMMKYLKQQYSEQIQEFRATIAQIGQRQGWTVGEARHRFSNEMLDELFYNNEKIVAARHGHPTAVPAQKKVVASNKAVSSPVTTTVREVSAD